MEFLNVLSCARPVDEDHVRSTWAFDVKGGVLHSRSSAECWMGQSKRGHEGVDARIISRSISTRDSRAERIEREARNSVSHTPGTNEVI